MGFIEDIIGFFAAPLRATCPSSPCFPTSTFIILGVAFLLSLMTTAANRFLVNYKMVTSYRAEYMSWQKAVNKARKEGEEKQLDKLMKKKAAMARMSSRATLEQMKTTAITFVPLILMYNVLLAVFGGAAVALSPLYIPGAAATSQFITKCASAPCATVFSIVYWYFLSSFTISIPLSRLFGIQTFNITPTSGDSK